ncbi:hypothetical protein FI667_g10592, partial [Globisporangium splendens]
MRARPATAADQGPFDWLVPFIPPFLRVNRDTRAALLAKLQTLDLDALAAQLVAFLRAHGARLAYYGTIFAVWAYGLVWMDRKAPEFAPAYVIVTGLGALVLHLFTGERTANANGISAYSVFNKGGARMLGSLSAEQFEVNCATVMHLSMCVVANALECGCQPMQNEILHRQPDYGNAGDDHGHVPADPCADGDENDPDLLLAMQLSLQEKKREERRARRMTRRR